MNKVKLMIFILGMVIILAGCSDSGYKYTCPYSPDISSDVLSPYGLYTSLSSSQLIVMSRNIYLGADFSNLIDAFNAEAMFAEAGFLLDDLIDSEFERRARGIAREIKEIGPDVVGLQEVVTIFTGKADFINNSSLNADCIEYDFLAILQAALTAENLNYSVAISSINADIELTDKKKDIRLRDSDVILVNDDTVSVVAGSDYAKVYNINFEFLGGILLPGLPDVIIKRSYSKISVTHTASGEIVTIINTHLETQGFPFIQEDQGDELIAYINSLNLDINPVILVGDINSDPGGSTPTYDNIMAYISGITDSWDDTELDNGFTCCYSSDLSSGTLSERIDHIFYINPTTSGLTTIISDDSYITQESSGNSEKVEKTDGTFIWSSDHAGRVTGFTFGVVP